MVINLTTPWEAGSIDDGATYAQAKVVGFTIGIENHKRVEILVEFGDTVDIEGVPTWVAGKTGAARIKLSDRGSEPTPYRTFLQANAAVLGALQTALYATLQELYPTKAAGTVV